MYCIVTLAIIMVAIVLDIQVAYYFDKTIKSCAFRDGHERCYCSATKSDFDYIFNGVGEIECNNVATRNPSMLNTSAAFSVACFLVCSLLFISLLSGFLSVTSAGMLDFEPPSVLAESSNSAQSRLHDTDEERL